MPTRAALLLTNRCNLNCLYCYSSAGSSPKAELSREAAFAAVDLIVENARRLGTTAYLILHGGGEPSCAWRLLQAVVDHFETRSRQVKVGTYTAIATNGVIPLRRLAWLAEHVQEFCISWDGSAEAQDRQRPKAGGKGSHSDVMRTFSALDASGKKYFVMATVTAESLTTLPSMIPLLSGRPGCRAVFLGPVYAHGRGAASPSLPPAQAFIEICRAVTRSARAVGLEVAYVGARAHVLTDRWCDATAADTSFDVTPQGLVSSCYMVTDPSDPRAKLFIHGRYDADAGKYVFDGAVQARLHSRNVESVRACRTCFCKYNCGSGCLNQAPSLYGVNRYRCRLNRTLTLDQLVDAIDRAEAAPVGGVPGPGLYGGTPC